MKRYLVALIGILAIMAFVAAGCGGDDDGDTDTGKTETTKTQEADTDDAAADEKAKELFVASCGSCHVLEAAGTSGTVGPNLDETKSSKAKIETQIKDGSEGMQPGLLTGENATEVTDYIVRVAGK